MSAVETGEIVAPTFDWPAGVHPAADLFPMLSSADFAGLVADIAENGQREAIVLDKDGRLLDGRNRLAAVQRCGLEPKTRSYEGDKPTELVISLNVHRRHLTQSQLSMIAAESLPLFEADAKLRQGERRDLVADVPPSSEKSRDAAGAAVGVGGRSVSKAKRVLEAAPDLAEQVKSGELTVSAAEKKVAERGAPTRTSAAVAERVEVVRRMATEGHSVAAIADAAGVTEERVQIYAKQYGFEIAARTANRSAPKIDHNRIVVTTVETVAALKPGVDMVDISQLDPASIEGWVSSLSESIRFLTTLKNKLNKELTRG